MKPPMARQIWLPMLVGLACYWGAIAPAECAPLCVPVEGAPFAATLTAVTSAWEMTFASDGKPRTLPAADVVQWGTPVEPTARSWLLLSDGGLLVAEVKEADRDRITVDSPLFGELQIPLELLAGIVLDAPTGHESADRLVQAVRSAQGNSDQLLLDNGDKLTGSLRAIQMNVTNGTGKLKLEAEVGAVEIAADRVVAVTLNPTLVAKPALAGTQALVGLSDGSRLRAGAIELHTTADQDGTAWITLAGKLTWQTGAREIVFVQPLEGRAKYLSDVEPAGYRQISFLDTPGAGWELGRDSSASGRHLRCGSRLYLKGLGMHSASRVSYEIGPDDRRFEATIGIDDEAGSRGSVVFRVYVDNEARYASPVLRGGEPPIPISVDIRGGQKLNLIVDFADRGDQLDRADWLDARLVR